MLFYGYASYSSARPLLGGFYFMVLLRILPHAHAHARFRLCKHAGTPVKHKIRHHDFPALVTWSVTENNLSDFVSSIWRDKRKEGACILCDFCIVTATYSSNPAVSPHRQPPAASAMPPAPAPGCPPACPLINFGCDRSRCKVMYTLRGHFTVFSYVFLMRGSKL